MKKWTNKEIDFLKNNYGIKSNLDISKRLNRSLLSIYHKSRKSKFKSNTKIYFKKRKKDYKNHEDNIIKKYWGKLQAREIKRLYLKNRSCCSLRHRANKLNLISSNFSNPIKKNGMYKHGLSRYPYPIKWNENLKNFIRKRDKICKICLKKTNNRKLSVHHIDNNKKNLNRLNLISLCIYCHSKITLFQDDLRDQFYAINLKLTD